MKKTFRFITTLSVVILLAVCVGTSSQAQAKSKKRTASKQKKAAVANSKQKKAAVAKKSSGKKGKAVASRSRRSRSRYTATSKRQSRSARSRLSKGSSSKLSRSARRRRARALYLARLRAMRARDAALRNLTNNYIEKDQIEGEDPEIRQAVLNAMSGRSATVVVMDPNTGRIFTVVNQQMALRSPVKPCSTVKMIVGLAALNQKAIEPDEAVQISRRSSMDLTYALAKSNNPFFQVIGRSMGYDQVIKYAENYGFGEKTGVNYANESEGFIPEEGTTLMPSHGDGFGVTAIQLSAFTAAIANGGNLYVPRVPRTAEDAAEFKPELKRKIEMSDEDRTKMMPGMIGAVNFGTARPAANPMFQVAGKTGTCTGNRDKLRLFTSFSSVENPKVVVTVITTDSKLGGNHATAIAGKIYASIAHRFFRERVVVPVEATAEVPASIIKNIN
ncbi:MAG: penicillin-binding transpeptidase domain-containing protein [Acidobacteriota bacterium]|nr:penicillin-binding transpeptidase domain-containing protein [Acidobacteriota bacterium]